MTAHPATVPAAIQQVLDAIIAPAPPAMGFAEVPCTHCGRPAFHRGYEAGEVVQLCPRCELIVEYQHACQCGSRDLTGPCALRQGQ
jgi:hypothetical protein